MKFRHFQLPGAVRAAVDSRIQPWHRYHGFLTIILFRYQADAAKYDPHPAPGTRIYRVEEDPRQVLQMDVETFYQYSNMMLDQIAENVRFFFGFPNAAKTNMNPHGYWTHLTLLDNLAKAAAALGLVGDVAGLLTQAEEFRKLRAYPTCTATDKEVEATSSRSDLPACFSDLFDCLVYRREPLLPVRGELFQREQIAILPVKNLLSFDVVLEPKLLAVRFRH